VLSLLEHGCSGARLELYREVTEFGGGVKFDTLGEEQYLYMSIPLLADTLFQTWSPRKSMTRGDFLWDFVGLMNLLGNDFVPHGMALKINDNGIEHVLEALKTLLAKEGQLVLNGTYNPTVLQKLLVTLAAQEERWMHHGIRSKLEARVGATAAKGAEAIALAALNDRPVQWAAEKALVESKHFEGHEKAKWIFRPAWRNLYNQHALWSAKPAEVAMAYLKTLAWTLAYYAGSPVDLTWYYPWLLPPLFETLAEELYKHPAALTLPPLCPKGSPLKPVEQLAMVLPATSFHLLPTEYQKLPKLYPHAWPTAWSWFSMGRRFLWQCEPLIPLVQPRQIRQWMEECLDEE
jgi:5'-3' exonuclease